MAGIPDLADVFRLCDDQAIPLLSITRNLLGSQFLGPATYTKNLIPLEDEILLILAYDTKR